MDVQGSDSNAVAQPLGQTRGSVEKPGRLRGFAHIPVAGGASLLPRVKYPGNDVDDRRLR